MVGQTGVNVQPCVHTHVQPSSVCGTGPPAGQSSVGGRQRSVTGSVMAACACPPPPGGQWGVKVQKCIPVGPIVCACPPPPTWQTGVKVQPCVHTHVQPG